MCDQKECANLAMILDYAEDPREFDLVYTDDSDSEHADLEVLETSGHNDSWYVAGQEFGPTHIIHAGSWEDAWEEWIDARPTIAEDELIEAYGIVDDDSVRERYTEGHGPCPEYWQQDAWRAWHDGLRLAQTWYLSDLDDRAHAGECGYPELIEGYEYQSNASGTGIVHVGHYSWLNEVDPESITVRRKASS